MELVHGACCVWLLCSDATVRLRAMSLAVRLLTGRGRSRQYLVDRQGDSPGGDVCLGMVSLAGDVVNMRAGLARIHHLMAEGRIAGVDGDLGSTGRNRSGSWP